jgi:hypothetical protein
MIATLRGVTVRDLAHRARVGYWRTTRILTCRATPTPDELRALAAALFVDPDPDVAK